MIRYLWLSAYFEDGTTQIANGLFANCSGLKQINISNDITDYYFYKGKVEECVKIFAESEVVVGIRFHSIILAELMGKEIIPIVYDRKTLHTLEDQNIKNYICLEELEKADVNQIVDNAQRITEENI